MQSPIERITDNVPQACERLGISRTLIYKEINSGRLKAVKAGRRTIITRDAQAAWLGSLTSDQAS